MINVFRIILLVNSVISCFRLTLAKYYDQSAFTRNARQALSISLGMDETENELLPTVRSLYCNVDSFVAFVSRTHRKVDVFWINYEGKHVKYVTLKVPGDTFPIHTYVSHPWTFKDADSGDQLFHSCNNEVYYPEPTDQNNINVVFIGITGSSKFTYCVICREAHLPPHRASLVWSCLGGWSTPWSGPEQGKYPMVWSCL